MHILLLALVLSLAQISHSLVTLCTIRNLTSLTDDYLARITGDEVFHLQHSDVKEYVVAAGRERDEVEEVISTTLSELSTALVSVLDIPMYPPPAPPKIRCRVVVHEYHSFLSSTVRYFYAIQEAQMRWRWTRESSVLGRLEEVRRLWASRSGNKQRLSFIEQQIVLYDKTKCFRGKEVLRRGVEVVEYLNDLEDSFA